ncbi:T9SS type A sorting domain-containing protein [Lacibacter sp. H407]|uniref:T9SS type A sorting domain-containing protein n=1 Tax=Lacibacter sp. H407 TaxID=3133423 RepID=UPI0030C41059
MKSTFLSATLLVMIVFSKAQTIQPTVLNSSGSSGIANNIHFEFNLGESFTTTIGNGTFITQGLLQPITLAQAPLPVLGLEFNAKRINNSKVQLDWKTVQEIDNKGFYVEWKKENEINFTQLHFVKSAAPNGNSSSPLNYSHVDANDFRGKTYYRLKQEDIDGKFMYSIVRLVNGNNGKVISMKAWPIPSTGPVNISADGIENDVLFVFDNNGRLMKQLTITAQTPVQLTGLAPGTYIVKLGSQKELYQKIIVQ